MASLFVRRILISDDGILNKLVSRDVRLLNGRSPRRSVLVESLGEASKGVGRPICVLIEDPDALERVLGTRQVRQVHDPRVSQDHLHRDHLLSRITGPDSLEHVPEVRE